MQSACSGCVCCQTVEKISAWVVAGRLPTDGAVLSVPARLALALAVLAGAVLHTQRVAHALVARGARPAFLAAARAAHTHAVRPAVHRAHL